MRTARTTRTTLVTVLALGALGTAGAALAACGPRPAPGGVLASDAIVRLRGNVPEAGVWVDGAFIGPLGGLRGGLAVVAGAHRLEIRHDDYVPRYLELTVRAAERRTVEVTLVPVLP